ncbi:putative mitochondrial protein ymf40 [Apostasia shenzhenica]|uniref:Putative mitochondrial protein ymf40 n=1 Tax=Apostasia shenzhenica TaxID=1088818 RepID=A0A2I0BGY6_9ASPA|nr:putative mitochondrial protein ymf40 [Apostasia shenzhenica]
MFFVLLSMRRVNWVIRVSAINFEKWSGCFRWYGVKLFLEDVEDCYEKSAQLPIVDARQPSLAKSLACLPDVPFSIDNKQRESPMKMKRLIEVRIKKRAKAQYVDGKFYNLMTKVIANDETLRDCYELVRLNSKVQQMLDHQLCFSTIANQLRRGEFDVKDNSISFHAKSGQRDCLVLPTLKLRVIQEAVRIVLEIVYRPHFSKISHGCRSGRGHRSALRFVQKEIRNGEWWFTISMNKVADINVISKLMSSMEQKIEDDSLFQFIHQMFEARVLNLVFGVFPKGQGLPQEGVLSPILMNIYLDIFDSEVFRMSLIYEGIWYGCQVEEVSQCSKLRRWFRQKIKSSRDSNDEKLKIDKGVKLNVCRYMDEILVSVSGTQHFASCLKSEIINFLANSLHLDVENQMEPKLVEDGLNSLQFLGTVIRVKTNEAKALRAVHKLRDKVQLFASQKQKIWDSLTIRIGKKCLAHGLRRLKESEIKQLGLSTPILDHISQFRKPGMKTDHWFKSLLQIWLQDVNAKIEADEETILSKYIVEPALPQDLRDSFHNFIKQANEYVSSESAATLALLKSSSIEADSHHESNTKHILVEAPVNYLKKCLLRYGVVNSRGYPRHVSNLVLQDDAIIISWFTGLSRRWLRWYSEFENIGYIKLLIAECIRKSCIRTLGAKYQMHEDLIEKRFDSELGGIPMIEELDEPKATSTIDDGDDESLMYGTCNNGLCSLSLSRVKIPARNINCFVMGCPEASPSMYTLHVKERQRFPGWKTGFASSIHPSLNAARIALCSQHVEALYLGEISLQSIEFGALRK